MIIQFSCLMSLGRRTGRTTWRPARAAMGYDENVLKADYFMYVPGEMDESIFDSK